MKRPAIIVIDSATYLLTISSPDINKVAMSLYDIIIIICICMVASHFLLQHAVSTFTPLRQFEY